MRCPACVDGMASRYMADVGSVGASTLRSTYCMWPANLHVINAIVLGAAQSHCTMVVDGARYGMEDMRVRLYEVAHVRSSLLKRGLSGSTLRCTSEHVQPWLAFTDLSTDYRVYMFNVAESSADSGACI